MKFFGELYNYGILDKDIVFLMLYKLISYGSGTNNPKLKNIDPSDDTFRISMVCTLLDTVAEFFKTKKVRPKVVRFLLFFQHYILSKDYVPIHVEFAVLDTLENLAPNIIKLKKMSDAVDLCKRIIEKEKNGTIKSYEEELEIANK